MRHSLKLLSETLIQAWREELRSKHGEKLLTETSIQAPILADPQAPIQASILADLQAPIHSLFLCWCVHMWVCLVLWCLWLIFDFMSVGVCVSEEEEDDEEEQMRWFCRWRRERKKE